MTIRTCLWASVAFALPLSAAAETLTVFEYSGFEDPAFHTTYTAKHGNSPDFAFFGDEEEAFQKLSSGYNEPGLTHVCAGSVTKFVESGIIEPWDTSRIPAFADLNGDLTGTSVLTEGDTYFIPADYGSTATAYNADEVPAEDVASLDVFLNPKYQGRVTIPDNVDDAFALAYLATGVTDWATVDDAQFEAAADWLRQAHQNMRTYWVDPGELSQLLSSGEVLVSWAWNETLPTMVEENFPIGFQREATEGSSLWVCGYVNMAESESSEDLVYDYLNAFLDESSTQALMDNGYGHSNLAAFNAQIDESGRIAGGLGPVSAPVLAQLPMPGELREKQATIFERIKAGF